MNNPRLGRRALFCPERGLEELEEVFGEDDHDDFEENSPPEQATAAPFLRSYGEAPQPQPLTARWERVVAPESSDDEELSSADPNSSYDEASADGEPEAASSKRSGRCRSRRQRRPATVEPANGERGSAAGGDGAASTGPGGLDDEVMDYDASDDAAARSQLPHTPSFQPSQPITIALAPNNGREHRHPAAASVYTPPEPLSARGDLPGGYFPYHEDPKERIYRPHPFHVDANAARQRSISLAGESASLYARTRLPYEQSPPPPTPPPAPRALPPMPAMAETPDQTVAPVASAPPAADGDSSNAPVASYIPNGLADDGIPLGKYYPTNWENRNGRSAPHLHAHSSASAAPAASSSTSSGSESQTAQRRTGPPTVAPQHSDQEDRQKLLLQYKRDMVTQASMAAHRVVATVVRANAANGADPLTGIPPNLQLPPFPRPVSPRLAPMGSPGPVTPMELESGDGGYLGRGMAALSLDRGHRPEAAAKGVDPDEQPDGHKSAALAREQVR